MLVEIPWNTLMALLVFVSWYYPIGLHQNAVVADQTVERGALMFLYILTFMLFAGTFTHMIIAGVETAEGAGAIINLLFSLSLIFCGYVTWLHPHVSLAHGLTDRFQCACNTRSSARLLDIHVPCFSPHLFCIRRTIRRPRQRTYIMLLRRAVAFLAAFHVHLLRISH